jgi:hypothetical protein
MARVPVVPTSIPIMYAMAFSPVRVFSRTGFRIRDSGFRAENCLEGIYRLAALTR